MTARGRTLARSLSILAIVGMGLVLASVLVSGIAAAPRQEQVYTNCYYGDDGNGNPTGVSSIEAGGSCAPGTSAECTGTIQTCDRKVGFGN